MKRTVILVCVLIGAVACGSQGVTGAPKASDATAAASRTPAATPAAAISSCEELLPWFEWLREAATTFGEPYDADEAAAQVTSWLRDPAQMEADLGGLGEMEPSDGKTWDVMTPAEQQASLVEINSAAIGTC